MGEKNSTTITPKFDKRIKISFTGSTVTSDSGALMLAEMDNKLHLTRDLAQNLHDPRISHLTIHTMESLLKQRLYSIAAGYEDADDADHLRDDPALKAVCGKKDEDATLASQPSICRLENHLLRQEDNLKILEDENLRWALLPYRLKGRKRIHLDADSYDSPAHGSQEGSSYNGYFQTNCYHPLVLHDGYGSKLKIKLRPGNVHTAHEAVSFMEPVLKHLRQLGFTHITFSGDSGFADPQLYTLIEQYRSTYYIRIKANEILQRKAADLYDRPPGRPSSSPTVRYKSFFYKADSWDHYRRIVVKSVLMPCELFPNVYFLVTNDHISPSKKCFHRYHKRRGVAEQHNDEGKNQMFATRLSCHEEKANAVRLQLYTLAYNMLNLFRLLALTGDQNRWTMNTIRVRLIKLGARITHHARSLYFLVAAGPSLRRLITNIFNRINRLPAPVW